MPDALIHGAWGMVAMWVVSAALRAVPPAQPMDSKLYLWFATFCGLLGANFDKITGKDAK